MKTNYALVDQLGVICEQIAALEAKAKSIKDELKAAGPGTYEAEFYRATVVQAERHCLDVAAARAKLIAEGFERWVKRHTTTTKVESVRITEKRRSVA